MTSTPANQLTTEQQNIYNKLEYLGYTARNADGAAAPTPTGADLNDAIKSFKKDHWVNATIKNSDGTDNNYLKTRLEGSNLDGLDDAQKRTALLYRINQDNKTNHPQLTDALIIEDKKTHWVDASASQSFRESLDIKYTQKLAQDIGHQLLRQTNVVGLGNVTSAVAQALSFKSGATSSLGAVS